jgi:cell division protease FtsH
VTLGPGGARLGRPTIVAVTADGERAPDPRIWLWVLGALAINALFLMLGNNASSGPARVDIAYSVFKTQVEADNVTEITITGQHIEGHTRKPVRSTDGSQKATDFSTTRPAYDDASLQPLLEAHRVTVSATVDSSSTLVTVLLSVGPVALIVGLLVFMYRRSAGAGASGTLGMGRSRARRYDATRPGVTFADVAGVDEAKLELGEVVDFLREPMKYQRLGGTMPRGVLLVGPPGTGKTLLARAVAGEAGVAFFSVSASEFIEMLVGVGAARVRDLFGTAREAAPSIIFIDELDAAGRSRAGTLRLGGHDEQDQTLNQILTEMDGFDPSDGVVVLAATNRPDVLDQALLRPGRFDRQVVLDPPDRAGREAILRVHARGVTLSEDVDLGRIAAMTTGMVGAELHNLVNEAALTAARRGHDAVLQDDIEEAFDRVVLGAERHLVMTEEDRRRTACHEAGHALLGLLLPGADPVRKVTIVPHGRALGVTLQSPVNDRRTYPEDYLRVRIVTALGGRAAESLVLGVVSTGAENDLQQATHIAHEMVVRWGMSPRVGALHYGDEEGGHPGVRPYSEDTARLVDAEVRRIIDECLEQAGTLLRTHRSRLEALSGALLSAEHLEEDEILDVAGLRRSGGQVVELPHTPASYG